MVESFRDGNVLTDQQADERAREIAVSVHGEEDWNKGGWPTNLGKEVSVRNNISLLFELKKGPIYGYYAGDDGAHLIVITGVNIWTGTIYTNNPWEVSGGQTREEFSQGFLDKPSYWDMPFVCGFRVN